METEAKLFLHLLQIKASLLKEIEKLDLAIELAMPKDITLLNKLVNNMTLGVYDYPINAIMSEKVSFALGHLGSATVDNIIKYLIILGEHLPQKQLKISINETIKKLVDNKVLNEHKIGKDNLYSLLK
ncbi:hypothetical protein AQ505_12980 [Pedobacter sp. PACM 27299]|uniref:hypothetical protein n=1 Tax=Pedobacter sp. PACM 27299 TaxID=1727164 RepID=UPI0007056D78|nr:hypothetical protein [Pedobacter sp. PACM 27299]ALL06332.1 hypothetical protein AQ505_12980 [Pedobacter sp. PACM 27299]